MPEGEITQAKLATKLANAPESIPVDVFDAIENGIPHGTEFQRVLQAIYLHPVFEGILQGDLRPEKYEVIIDRIGEDCFSLPFQEIIIQLLPKIAGKFLTDEATTELRTIQQRLRLHKPSDIESESAQERAFRFMNGTSGETWTFELGPLEFFGVYWGKLIEHIVSVFEKRNTPLSDEQLVEVLAHSSKAIAAPPAMLDRQALDRLLPLKAPEFEQALARYIHVTDTDASFIISTDELDPENISQRRCPMSTFGTIKQVYSFYVDAARYILEARQKQAQQQPN